MEVSVVACNGCGQRAEAVALKIGRRANLKNLMMSDFIWKRILQPYLCVGALFQIMLSVSYIYARLIPLSQGDQYVVSWLPASVDRDGGDGSRQWRERAVLANSRRGSRTRRVARH